jgi:hypothetical protein
MFLDMAKSNGASIVYMHRCGPPDKDYPAGYPTGIKTLCNAVGE